MNKYLAALPSLLGCLNELHRLTEEHAKLPWQFFKPLYWIEVDCRKIDFSIQTLDCCRDNGNVMYTVKGSKPNDTRFGCLGTVADDRLMVIDYPDQRLVEVSTDAGCIARTIDPGKPRMKVILEKNRWQSHCDEEKRDTHNVLWTWSLDDAVKMALNKFLVLVIQAEAKAYAA